MNSGQFIWVVDDDKQFFNQLKAIHQSAGRYFPDSSSLISALLQSPKEYPEVIYLDYELEESTSKNHDGTIESFRIYGTALVAQIRNVYPDVPIIAISGIDEEKIAAQWGAQSVLHFLQKPLTPAKVIYRFQSAQASLNTSLVRYGDLVFNKEYGVLKGPKLTSKLTPRDNKFLMIFMSSKEVLVSKERLITTYYGDKPPGKDALAGAISSLRKLLKKHSNIVNVDSDYGDGYRLSSGNSSASAE